MPHRTGEVSIQGCFKHSCPWCGNEAPFNGHGNYTVSTGIPAPGSNQLIHVSAGLFRCQTCERPLLVTFESPGGASTTKAENCKFFPPVVQTANPDIPDAIRKDFQEALNCFGAGAWNAVGAMTRRAIQRAVIEKGGEGKDLYNQIEDLKAKGKLVGSLVEFAHQVRIVGRDGSHAEAKFIDLDQVDAEDAIEFCRECFDHLFVTPKRLERQRHRRAK